MIKPFGYIIVMGQENHSEEWRFDDFNENVADYDSDDIAVAIAIAAATDNSTQ